ncbi:hypothetical protein MTQ10_08465 [Streptomyces sp. XM83C]|jgi:hypothetical protein|uniref:Uncharacterized protein n=1 Tax=Streptomyces thermocoprophilus TaxID=78356 RepID=A0ABV5VLI5_9ACTN|nr:hypothetical protein [Streptomyces sp. XM83C]MCK1819641.1 hypothetical protein [Streptomyces sp. XM83C]
MLATRVSKIVASVLLAAGGTTLSVAAFGESDRIQGTVKADSAAHIAITADHSSDDVTWGK